MLDDSFDTAGTQGPAGLREFLGDDGHGGLRIQEAMANDLPDDFIRAAVVPMRSALPALQGEGTPLSEGPAKLKVALLAESELACRLKRSETLTLTGDEHREFAGDLVV